MLSAEVDEFELKAPAQPAQPAQPAAQVQSVNDDDIDLETELGLPKSPAQPVQPAKPAPIKMTTSKTVHQVKQKTEDEDEDVEGPEVDPVDEVAAAAASAAKWFGGLWSAASNVVVSAAENVQKNPDINRAFDAARLKAQEAISVINSEKLRETMANVSEVANRGAKDFTSATLASIDKVLDVIDPIENPEEYGTIEGAEKVKIIVASANPIVVAAVVETFERVHGPDGFYVKGHPVESTVAKQPIGYDSGLQGAKSRVTALLESSGQKVRDEGFLLVGFEPFIVELGGAWYDVTAIHLYDAKNNVSCSTFTQATEVAADSVQKSKDLTLNDYQYKSTGTSVTVASLIALTESGVDETNWHYTVSNGRISYNQILSSALTGLYGQYYRKQVATQ